MRCIGRRASGSELSLSPVEPTFQRGASPRRRRTTTRPGSGTTCSPPRGPTRPTPELLDSTYIVRRGLNADCKHRQRLPHLPQRASVSPARRDACSTGASTEPWRTLRVHHGPDHQHRPHRRRPRCFGIIITGSPSTGIDHELGTTACYMSLMRKCKKAYVIWQ